MRKAEMEVFMAAACSMKMEDIWVYTTE